MSYSIISAAREESERSAERLRAYLAAGPKGLAGPEDLAYREENTCQHVLALVLAVYRWRGHSPERTRDMAFLFELLYLSRVLLLKVRDEAEGQRHDRQLQLSVLLSDYYLGEALHFLTSHGGTDLIPYFSQILAGGSEGLVEHFYQGRPEEETLGPTHGALYRGIFYSADRLQTAAVCAPFAQLGYHLGMTLELGWLGSAARFEHQQWLLPLYQSLPPAYQHPDLLKLIREMEENR
jgi:hypothetical protein